ASTRFLPEIVTVPAGLAVSVPAKAEPSDIDTETAATVVPAAALSGSEAVLGVNVTPAGIALTWTWIEPETVTPFWAAATLHWGEPLSAAVRARASTSLPPEIVTVPDGLAVSVPAKAEPSDIDTETAATMVPAAALSGSEAVLGVNVTPVGRALTWTWIEPETVTPFCVAATLHWGEPLSAAVRARASTSLPPEIVTVPAGLAVRAPAKAEPSDIDTETAATMVPAAALSGSEAVLGVNVTPVGRALTWTWIEPETVTPFCVAATLHWGEPLSAAVRARASTSLPLEIVTVPDGFAVSVPANAEPSDIDTETAATMVPAAALSGSEAVLGVNVTPTGMALTWTWIEPETVTPFWAAATLHWGEPLSAAVRARASTSLPPEIVTVPDGLAARVPALSDHAAVAT